MPAKPTWFLRIPAILAELENLPVPFLDRPAVERLFGVRRRRANQLMARFCGFQAGRTFLADRQQLLAWLRSLENGQEFVLEERRRARVLASLEEARRHQAARRVRIAPADNPPLEPAMQRLPAGIRLRPGELRIEFVDAQELLRRLLELSQAIMHDYHQFEMLIEHTTRK